MERALQDGERSFGMQYLVFAIGAAAILIVGRSIYVHLEGLSRTHRLRGARECLDAVQNTLTELAKSKPDD